MLAKLNGKAMKRACVQPLKKSFDHKLGAQIQSLDLRR
jgi:hypothetical protein